MKNLRKGIILIAALILSVIYSSVLLGGEVPPTDTSPPKFTFKNVLVETPRLSVSKELTALYPQYPPNEEETFTFQLTVEGSPAINKAYFLQTKDGKRIYNYASGYTLTEREGELELELKTDRNGRFSIQANQVAVFETIPVGSEYEISELQTQYYTQIDPAGSAGISGIIKKDGNLVTFTNRYEPELPPPDPENPPDNPDVITRLATTAIHVDKNIIYPSGYELPETSDFPFILNVSGQPWAEKEYKVKHNETYTEHTTGSNGSFSLKGGEEAIFEDIPLNADYTVSEQTPSGWTLITSSNTSGLTVEQGSFASFTNSELSFGVTKAVTNVSNDTTDFNFVLTNSNGQGIQANYYLYDINKELINENKLTTDSNGKFSLKSGQSAIFVGVPVGASYNIKEETQEGYQQVFPLKYDGVTNKTVSSSVATWDFQNMQTDKASLEIKKVLTGDYKDPNKLFEFTVTLTEGSVPLLDKYPCVVGGVESLQTLVNNRYTFSLKGGESFIIRDLPVGTSYVIKESDYTSDLYYTVKENDTGTLTEDTISTFRNNEIRKKVKVSKQDITGKEIAGASLTISGREDSASSDITPITWTSGSDGQTSGSYNPHEVTLMPGTYTLHENTAPTGYVKGADITFTIDKLGVIKVNNTEVNDITLVNDYVYHDLEVSKTISGSFGNKTKEFDFTLKLTNGTIALAPTSISYDKTTSTGTTSGTLNVTASDGKFHFKLGHNETIKFKHIPYGIGYEVLEENVGNYTATYTNNTGSITEDKTGNKKASVENQRNMLVPTDEYFSSTLGKTLLVIGISILIILCIVLWKRRMKVK